MLVWDVIVGVDFFVRLAERGMRIMCLFSLKVTYEKRLRLMSLYPSC